MNITNEMQYPHIGTALMLIIIGCVTGYAISETHMGAGTEAKEFDIFSYKAIEVNGSMNFAFENPSNKNLQTVNNKLALGFTNWAGRQNGDNKELFIEYLDSCKLVINEMQAGHDVTDEKKDMYKMYGKLRNE